MHVPDGFFNAATSLGAGAVAAGALASALRHASRELTDRLTPMTGLVAASIFALQMLSFPVASGTSGHLLGGALAAVLVGPWIGSLCIAVVLLVQSLLFADGGLSAYGINVLLIAVVPSFSAWFVFRTVRLLLPATTSAVVGAAAVAAYLSVPATAAVFVFLFGVGGAVELSMSSLLAAMVGVHLLIGLGEAAITAVVVRAVVSTRPDLALGATDLRPELEPVA